LIFHAFAKKTQKTPTQEIALAQAEAGTYVVLIDKTFASNFSTLL
jgi:phage-related protein